MTLVVRNAAQLLGRDNHHITADGSVIIREGRIAWLGRAPDLPPLPGDVEMIDATGKTIMPGLVDSHTHLIFAGSREDEFEQRLLGISYQQIAAQGGGINATVRRVRQASKDELKALARPTARIGCCASALPRSRSRAATA